MGKIKVPVYLCDAKADIINNNRRYT